MENLFPERFTELLNEHKFSYQELIKKLDLKSKGTITKYANGQIKNVGAATAVKIANLYGVSPMWLIGLIDDKYFDVEVQYQYTRIPIVHNPNERNNIIHYNDSNSIIVSKKFANNFIATICIDDSMYPMIFKNDIVIVKQQTSYENNQICLIDNNKNEFIIRKVQNKGNNIILEPLNTKYPTITYSIEAIQKSSFKIVGIVDRIERLKL